MSVDDYAAVGAPSTATTTATREFPEPRAHGAATSLVLNDLAPSEHTAHPRERSTLYGHAIEYWREHVSDRAQEPALVVDDLRERLAEIGRNGEWLPDGRIGVVLTSTGWKAGLGTGSEYSQWYDQQLKLRRLSTTDDGELELTKPALSCHLTIAPQYSDMVYSDGSPLETPYGDGTWVKCQTTWAESGHEIETRLFDVLAAVYGPDSFDRSDVNYASRRVQKAEAHNRFHIRKKNSVIDTLEQSKELVAYGGDTEIDAHQRRMQEGWVEARCSADRWELLGFRETAFDTEVKVYQASGWHKKPQSDFAHHPKLEASFNGVSSGRLPHVDEWDEVMQYLRSIVAAHSVWAGMERGDLVADDYFDGPAAPRMEYEHPEGRREQLYARYRQTATELYREALKASTDAVYDILRVIARENGATYDRLELETGLARSTIRYHVSRMVEEGVLERLGNPVLVVFDNPKLLEKARDVVRHAKPGDTLDEQQERRERRQERRQEQQARDADADADSGDDLDEPASADDPESEATGDDSEPEGGEGAASRDRWRYLDELPVSVVEVAYAHADGDMSDRDIRVRLEGIPDRLLS